MNSRAFHRAPTRANHHMGVHTKRDPLGDYRRHQGVRHAYLSFGPSDVVISVSKDLQAENFILSVRLRAQRTARAAWTKPNGYIDQPFPSEALALAAQRQMVAHWRDAGWKPRGGAQPKPAPRAPVPRLGVKAKPARKVAKAKPARKVAKAKPARKVAKAKPARKAARRAK